MDLSQAGRLAEAIVELQRSIERDPHVAQNHLHLGDAYAAAKCPAAAEDAYRSALKVWADYPEAHVGLGRLLAAEGRATEAIAALETGVRLQPENLGGLFDLAILHEQRQQIGQAVKVMRRLLARSRGSIEALKTLSRLLCSLGELPEALEFALQAGTAAPGDADAQFGLGNVLLRMQQPQESLAAYRRALALVQTPKARFAEASPLLMLGEFAAGWDAYEARLGMLGVPWKISAVRDRLWDGGPIGNRRLLVHTEQGLGDTFQFVRYLPLVRSRAGPDARIELLCEPELARLLGMVDGIDALHAPERLGFVDYDLQIPLLSLPQRFGTTLETIPSSVPYLRLPVEAKVRIERPAGTKLAVAFAWAGRPTHADDGMRSCPIQRFAPLFDLSGIQFWSIQGGARSADVEPYLARRNVANMTADLTATLAVMEQADLVIAVDTSMVHLAGAYAKPVWTLLGYGADWRWLLGREDTPWYPTMRLFRQRAPGDWDETVQRVRAELQRMAG